MTEYETIYYEMLIFRVKNPKSKKHFCSQFNELLDSKIALHCSKKSANDVINIKKKIMQKSKIFVVARICNNEILMNTYITTNKINNTRITELWSRINCENINVFLRCCKFNSEVKTIFKNAVLSAHNGTYLSLTDKQKKKIHKYFPLIALCNTLFLPEICVPVWKTVLTHASNDDDCLKFVADHFYACFSKMAIVNNVRCLIRLTDDEKNEIISDFIVRCPPLYDYVSKYCDIPKEISNIIAYLTNVHNINKSKTIFGTKNNDLSDVTVLFNLFKN